MTHLLMFPCKCEHAHVQKVCRYLFRMQFPPALAGLPLPDINSFLTGYLLPLDDLCVINFSPSVYSLFSLAHPICSQVSHPQAILIHTSSPSQTQRMDIGSTELRLPADLLWSLETFPRRDSNSLLLYTPFPGSQSLWLQPLVHASFPTNSEVLSLWRLLDQTRNRPNIYTVVPAQ